MTGLRESALEKLEFPKVVQRALRYAASDPGREVLLASAPSFDLTTVRDELALVTDMKSLLEEEGDLPLEGIHPVREVLQTCGLEGSVLEPRELHQVASTLRAARLLRAFLLRRRDRSERLAGIAEPLTVDKVLEYNIEQAVDEHGSVRDSASRALREIRAAIAERSAALRRRLELILRAVSEKGLSQEEIITTREGRMVIPVKAEHRNHVPGFVHSASASGATVFVEPAETLELNNEIRGLHFEEQREIQRILRDLTAQVRAQRDALLLNLEILARTDALRARGKYSIEILGTAPEIRPDGPLLLRDARHPMLLMAHGREATVPVDLELGGDVVTLVISGPNAGGKSVAMKAVGLLAVMAQSGFHIPADPRSSLRVFRSFYVDIGDEQSIENDLSTFSSHLANLREIAANADEESLVLIDEIGSGTDPTEGGAIAAAVLLALTERRALTVATTHHGGLKAFAHETPGVENGAMEFDQTTLTPTYRFRMGVPGSSYALAMAARMGLEPAILEQARRFAGDPQQRLDTLLGELESRLQEARRRGETVAREQTRLDELVRTYEAKLADQKKELREIRRKAVEEARAIVEGANTVVERTVRELREQGADRETVKRSRTAIAEERGKVEDLSAGLEEPAPPEEPGSLHIGGRVRIREGDEVGELASVAPDGSSGVVIFGNVKMKVALRNLVPAGGKEPRRRPDPGPAEPPVTPIPREIDLRGMTGDEALPLVDKFLDDALLRGLRRVDIIHGKGTGALRKKVVEFLARHPHVRSYRYGEWNEGGTGATVVELAE